jgi:hypothetical protein
MKKTTPDKNVKKVKTETQVALQTVYDALNQGQQKKIAKDDSIKKLFDRYGVIYG